MADTAPLFKILADGSDVAFAPKKMVEGDSPSAAPGLIGFSFKDSSGNVVLPSLTAAGKIMVDVAASGGSKLKARGENATGSLTTVTIATITLTASKLITDFQANGSCLRECLFQIIWNDNASETILGEFVVGAGQFSFHWNSDNAEFTSGATGTQQLLLKAKNIDKVSTIRGDASLLQAA